jgi:ABC-2 type transport system permease protein
VRGSIAAELLVLRKRRSTWILLGIWTALATFFSYLLPYVEHRSGDIGAREPDPTPLEELLPESLVGHLSVGFPFFGGVFALMLGVLALGSEYGWGTLRTVFVQRPGRLRVFAAKLVALGAGLVPFVLSVGRALVADWLILAVWAALGIALGVLSRGTALAIGVGIVYTLVIEGLISTFADQVGLLEPLVELFLRANAYSLVESLDASSADAASVGPGSFSGPYVGGAQASIALLGYVAVLLLLSGLLLRRRDVT